MTEHTFVVSRAEIRRFALAVGATDPVHHDVGAARAAGHRDLVAPAYFFQVFGMSLGRLLPPGELRADGLAASDDLSGNVVAAGSTVTLGAPICAGDEVRVEVSEEPPEIKQGSRGPLTLHTINRRYLVDGSVAADEAYLRIGY
jgi:acyl dehydratase